MKRMFTKWLGGHLTLTALLAAWDGEVLQWTAQENLVILGAQLAVGFDQRSENDGASHADLELSFSSTPMMDVAFLSACAAEGWNTSPAGIEQDQGRAMVMFPEGYGLSMKEGETLYLNIKDAAGKSAGDCEWFVNAHIYYVKGLATYK